MYIKSPRPTTLATTLATTTLVSAIAGLPFMLAGCQSVPSAAVNNSSNAYAIIDGEQTDVPQIAMGDKRSIDAIIKQGKDHSEVMNILRSYTVEYGPRLTGSSNLQAAQRWGRNQLADWGLSNARLETWGTIATRFDRGDCSGTIYSIPEDPEMDPIELRSMEFTTLSWSVGTDGPTRGPIAFLPETMDEYEANKGNYENAWILISPNYGSRGGVRSVGFLMRERMDERHSIRQEAKAQAELPETNEIDATESADPADGVEWIGTFHYNTSAIPTVLTIKESDEGITGSMAIEGFAEGPMDNAVRDGDTITFDWTHSMGSSVITINFDGESASGTSISSSGKQYDVNFNRADSKAIADEEVAFMDHQNVIAAVLAENPSGFISSSQDERVWTTSSNGWIDREIEDYPVDIEVNVRQSDFDYISARASEGHNIEVEFDLQHTLTAGPIPAYNVIAEIVGSEFPDEMVIISAHIDSWDGPGSMGATDNGTGSAVVTEAARILAQSGVKPKRTIRIALWGGEEQGLLGSKAHIDAMTEDELSKISAAFVDDGGTNYQGGIPAADFMVDYLAAASAPTNGVFFSKTDYDAAINDDDPDNDEMAGYLNVNIRPTGAEINTHGGSDHASFNRVGVPGFFWDETGRANYNHTWHTQHDTIDAAIEEYLIQSATNMAIVAFNLANAPGLVPRDGDLFEEEAPEEITDAEDGAEENTTFKEVSSNKKQAGHPIVPSK